MQSAGKRSGKLPLFILFWIAGIVSAYAQVGLFYQIPTNEYNALKDLYAKLNGANWASQSGWNDPDVEKWYGVTVTGVVEEYDPALGRNKIVKKGHVSLLNLVDTGMDGFIPSSIKEFTELKSLGFSSNSFTGSIPSEIGQLSKLETLSIWMDFKGELPSSLAALSELKSLWAVGTQYPGSNTPNPEFTSDLPSWLFSLESLEYVFLSGRFQGPIPQSMGSASKLTHLQLPINRLTGEIPGSLGDLPELLSLNLSQNELSGWIPMDLADLGKLQELDLGSNKLTGGIPMWMGTLPSLEYLVLKDNALAGQIPLSLGKLESNDMDDKSVFINLVSNCLDLDNAAAVAQVLPEGSVFSYTPQSECVEPELPDLRSSLMEVVQDEVQSNEKITIRFQVENLGTADAEGYYVSFYLSADPDYLDTDSQYLYTQWMPPLKAGESTSVQEIQVELPFTIPNAGTVFVPNTFYVGILVDPDNLIKENNEDNNFRQELEVGYDVVKIFGPALIEMVQFDARHVDHEGEGFVPGDTMRVDWILTNVGYDDAEPFELEFLLDPPIGSRLSEKYLGKVVIEEGLGSGDVYFDEFLVDLPLNPSEAYVSIGNGTYMVKPQIRPLWLESFEFWNPYFTGDEVYGDDIVMMGVCTDVFSQGLVVLDFYDDIKPGDQVMFEYRYKNASHYPMSEPFTIGVFLSKDPVIDPDTDMLVYTKLVTWIGPNTNVLSTAQVFNLPPVSDPFWGSLPQTYYVGMVIDIYQDLTDCDRSDNITTGLGVGSFVARSFVPPTVVINNNPPNGNGSVQAPYEFPARSPADLDCTPGGRFQIEVLEAKPLKLMEIIVEKQSGSGTIYFTADGSPPNPDNYLYKLELAPDDPGPYTFFLSSGDGDLRATFDLPGGLQGGSFEVVQGGKPVPGESKLEDPILYNFFASSIAISGDRFALGPVSLYQPPDHLGELGVALYDWIENQWQWSGFSGSQSPTWYGGSYYGIAVDISNDLLVVADTAATRIHAYRWNGEDWQESVINLRQGTTVTDVVIHGDQFAASILSYHATGESAVVFYEWVETEWIPTPVDTVEEASAGFGMRMALFGDTLAVMDPLDSAGQTLHIYRWEAGEWIHSNRRSGNKEGLAAPDFVNLAASDDMVVVGSPGNPLNVGVVFVYRWDGSFWNKSLLRPPEEDVGDHLGFGGYVAMSGNRLAVTSNGFLYVYAFDGTEWQQLARIEGVLYNDKLAIDGDYIAIAGQQAGATTERAGTIYNLAEYGKPPPEPVPPERWPTFDIRHSEDAIQVDIFRQPDTDAVLALPMQSPNLHDWAQVPQAPVRITSDSDPDSDPDIEHWRTTIPIEPDSPDSFIRVLMTE